MSVEGLLGTQEEEAARRLIAQASQALSRLDPEIPQDFLPQLYGRAVVDDLVGYEPDMLAQLGRRAWEFLRIRRPGAPKVRFDVIEPEPASPAISPSSAPATTSSPARSAISKRCLTAPSASCGRRMCRCFAVPAHPSPSPRRFALSWRSRAR
jgi:hypothetical protein